MSTYMKVPFVDLPKRYEALREPWLAAIDEIGRRGDFILGRDVTTLESVAARALGTRYCLAVANGTDALILILKALGIGAGCEVITASNSFVASAGAIVAVGATPVFADVGDDMLLDPAQVAARITPRTRAILPVHLTGHPVDMDALGALANAHALHVIEDAAQAIGARWQGRPVGSLGVAAGFSLHPLKNLQVFGDGGLITTDSEPLWQQLKLLRNHGLRDRDHCALFGLNSRLDTMAAALALLGFEHLETWTERHRAIAQRYTQELTDAVIKPLEAPGCRAVFHNYVLRVPQREALQAALLAQGIETKIHYPIPIHQQEAASALGVSDLELPKTVAQAKQILSLPIYPELEDAQVDWVIHHINRYFGA